MLNRAISVVVMICWGVVFVMLGMVVLVPPRQLTFDDVLQLLFIPMGAFVACLPGVPLRWFGYYSGLCAVPVLLGQSDHICGTLRTLGWADDFRAHLLAALMFVAVVFTSVAAAWLRQMWHKAIARRLACLAAKMEFQ